MSNSFIYPYESYSTGYFFRHMFAKNKFKKKLYCHLTQKDVRNNRRDTTLVESNDSAEENHVNKFQK